MLRKAWVSVSVTCPPDEGVGFVPHPLPARCRIPDQQPKIAVCAAIDVFGQISHGHCSFHRRSPPAGQPVTLGGGGPRPDLLKWVAPGRMPGPRAAFEAYGGSR